MTMTAKDWGTIVTSVLGAVILGLQGINLSEVSAGNQSGEKRAEMLEQLLALSKSMDDSAHAQTKILQNGATLLEQDDKAFARQTQILDTLKAAIAERKVLLQDVLKSAPTPEPSP